MTRPGIGHNLPSTRDRARELIGNADRWTKERPEITSEEHAGIADDFVTQLRAARDDLEKDEKAERAPHEQEIEAIKLSYRDIRDMVAMALTDMLARSTKWLSFKSERAKREAEAKRKAADAAIVEAAQLAHQAQKPDATIEERLAAQRAEEHAEDAVAAASRPVGRARVRGDYSPRAMSLREYWHGEIDDPDLALAYYRKHDAIVARDLDPMIERAATRHASREKRVDAAPPGVRFVRTEKAQ
jgi:hypothetical protein